jgi:uncharacterized protein
MHILTSECAPPTFLRVQTSRFLKKIGIPLKALLEIDRVRGIIARTNWLLTFYGPNNRRAIGRYIRFLDVAAQHSEAAIFRMALDAAKTYDANPRLVALTLDMDHMDNQCKPIVTYQTQLYQALRLKKLYPDNLFPFVSADPRSMAGDEMVEWVSQFFKTGVISHQKKAILPYCAGIKLYPALGFFPFDPGLDKMYAYAEREGIPLIFHCTRAGSQYIGDSIKSLIPHRPEMIMPENGSARYLEAIKAKEEILSRIARYRDNDWIKNNRKGDNNRACELFSHPQNYVPVMLKYPNLKICLAHMGGGTEVKYMDPESKDRRRKMASTHRRFRKMSARWEADGHNWANLIKQLMVQHENLYTDLSYTVTELENHLVKKNTRKWLVTKDRNNNELATRILFGSDFFMSKVEKGEGMIYELMRSKLATRYNLLARENPLRFLGTRCFEGTKYED